MAKPRKTQSTKKPKPTPAPSSELRLQAEERLKQCDLSPEGLFPPDAAALIHELQVHQIELEMQNDELRQAQARLEEVRQKYSDLYDSAPVGYLTLDRLGTILEANPAAGALLGVERLGLLGRTFPHFLSDADRKALRDQLGLVLQARAERRLEVTLKQSGNPLILLLNLSYFQDAAGRVMIRTSLTDITVLKTTQAALRQSEEKLRVLASKLLAAQELERQRISRDLHDELGQALMALKMQINLAKRKCQGQEPVTELDGAMKYLNAIAERVRSISRGLRPSVLENLGLAVALRGLLEEFERNHHLPVSLEHFNLDHHFSPEAQIAIYRIFQECLTNVAKHAGATRVTVQIGNAQDGTILFVIRDNGQGFDRLAVASKNPEERGLGLSAMEERVRMMGGSLKVTSRKGHGTQISFKIPPDAAPPEAALPLT